MSGAMSVDLIELQEAYAREEAEKALAAVRAAEQRSGLKIEWRVAGGDVAAMALLYARYADLVVVNQAPIDDSKGAPSIDMPETLVMGSGRPVLIVPRYGSFPVVGQRVLAAWKRTREATRAIHDALPILERAKSVRVMEFNPAADEREQHIPGADIAAHLAKHGVKVEVSSMTVTSELDVGDAVLSTAADQSIDLLVMGAYGHSRLREFAFGGVTRHLLQHMTVPVLMSH
jgi:nucleotide-binding universal stress UspA family protein